MAKRKPEKVKKPTRSKPELTTGEALTLEIARHFPETFLISGDRVTVRDDATVTEATRSMVKQDLAEMYHNADSARANKLKTKKEMKPGKTRRHKY